MVNASRPTHQLAAKHNVIPYLKSLEEQVNNDQATEDTEKFMFKDTKKL